MSKTTFIHLRLRTDYSDANLRRTIDTITTLVERVQSTCTRICVMPVCAEYDTDPRELWEIPEAVSLFKRAIEAGLYGVLTLPQQWKKMLKYENQSSNPLVYVYAIATKVFENRFSMAPQNYPYLQINGHRVRVWVTSNKPYSAAGHHYNTRLT